MEKLLACPFSIAVRGVSITSANVGAKLHAEFDFASRYFSPWNGIDEDPVNGSSHTILAGFYAQKLGKTKMKAFMASERTGILGVELLDKEKRVLLQGHAVTTLKGILAKIPTA